MEIKGKDISNILGIPYPEERSITSIVENIVYVQKDSLFVVRKGSSYDSFLDIDKALTKQALVVHENKDENRGYYIEGLEEKIEVLLAMFYEGISNYFKLIGVCGTNGKSSVVSYLYDSLQEEKRIKIGTHFITCDAFVYENENTTPSKITLMHILHLAYLHQIRYVLMEVSSHAIDQKRISLLSFDYIIYTNIERDHIDYHKTLQHYRYTKYKLAHSLKETGIVIANKDELYYQELKKVCHYPIITYGLQDAHFQIKDMQLKSNESTFFVNRYFFRMHLIGKINVYNVTAIIALLRLLAISYYSIYQKVFALRCLEGRLEVMQSHPYTLIVDYAHSAKAFYEVVSFLASLTHNRLIVVVGCGGEREKEKRAEIGYYADCFCDIIIFTEDNSRREDVYEIMQQMQERVEKEVVQIPIREQAIQYALKIAENNDIILVSGKGNENTLIRNEEVIPYNDKETIKMILE